MNRCVVEVVYEGSFFINRCSVLQCVAVCCSVLQCVAVCCRGGVRMIFLYESMCCRCVVRTNSPFVTHFQSCVVWIYRYRCIDELYPKSRTLSKCHKLYPKSRTLSKCHKLYPKSRTLSKCHKLYPIMHCLDWMNRCIAPHQIDLTYFVPNKMYLI